MRFSFLPVSSYFCNKSQYISVYILFLFIFEDFMAEERKAKAAQKKREAAEKRLDRENKKVYSLGSFFDTRLVQNF